MPLAVEQDGYSEFRKLQSRTRVSEAHWKDLADEVGFDLEKGLATPHLEVRLSKRDGSSHDRNWISAETKFATRRVSPEASVEVCLQSGERANGRRTVRHVDRH